MRSFVEGVAIRSKICIPKVVGKNENDVGFVLGYEDA
jgi:hypothetical protein